MSLKDKIRARRDTTANFTSANPVLSLGEISFDTTTKQFKVGDGSSTWTALPYSDAAATASSISTALAAYTPTSSLSAIATSGAASDLIGTLSKSQQHAQTAYLDASSQTFAGAATFNGAVNVGTSMDLIDTGSDNARISVNAILGIDVGGDLLFRNADGSAERARITSTGATFNGILRTTKPTNGLMASFGANGVSDLLEFNYDSGLAGACTIESAMFGPLVLSTKNNTNIVLDPNGTGKVRIGTRGTTPTDMLSVGGDIAASGSVTSTSTGKLGDFTVGTLPSAAPNTGHECNVTDSSVTTFGSAVAGGGSSRVKVYSNGTNWTIQAL
jgi:hypothetical protein